MRIVTKLTFGLVAGMTVILAANGVLRVRREVAQLHAERARDHELLARPLADAVVAVWRAEGPDAAVAMVRAMGAPGSRVAVSWVAAAAQLSPALVELGREARAAHGPATRIITDAHADGARRATLAPVEVGGAVVGLIELTEPLDAEDRVVRSTIGDTVVATAALALISGLLAALLGAMLVGRPMRVLVDKARRTGLGEFREPALVAGTGELAALAREMNWMAERLVAARNLAEAETRARLAALEQLRHADRLATVGKLASGVAHELGTPLNVVSARAAMIATGEAEPREVAEYARVIGSAADRMTRIIRQLLEFARRKGPERRDCDVPRLVADALEMTAPIANRGRVVVELLAGASVNASVDGGQLQQAVTNLVVNAIQASPAEGRVEVSVSATSAAPEPSAPARRCVLIAVRDQGAGIAPEHVERVFEPFFTTKEVGEGTGLGLSVCYGIATDHHGWIDVATGPAGTTFGLFLPVEAT